MNRLLRALVTLGVLVLVPCRALAQDASVDDGGVTDAGADMTAPACTSDSDCAGLSGTPFCSAANACVACVDYAGNPCVPVACDGALCDTTTGSACTVGRGLGRRGLGDPTLLVILVGALALALARRRSRRSADR